MCQSVKDIKLLSEKSLELLTGSYHFPTRALFHMTHVPLLHLFAHFYSLHNYYFLPSPVTLIQIWSLSYGKKEIPSQKNYPTFRSRVSEKVYVRVLFMNFMNFINL